MCLAFLFPACGDKTGTDVSAQADKPAAVRSASGLFADGVPAIPLSGAAEQTAEAAVNGALGSTVPGQARVVSVADFGAKGDDRSSDTDAIRKAIQALGGAGTVLFPAGTYYCAEIAVPSNVSLVSMTTFGFDGNGATQLVRNSRSAGCILDLTGSENVLIQGISIDGLGKSAQQEICGIRVKDARGVEISGGRIVTDYRGPAIYVEHSAGVSVRGCMLGSARYGVEAAGGEDLLIADCWLTSCHPAGYYGYGGTQGVRITANRIEWCGAGVLLDGVKAHEIIGNYFDRCSIGGIRATGGEGLTMLGNINQRNGVSHGTDESCSLFLDGVDGAVYRGNVMEAIRGDGNDTNVTPETAMILRGLKNSQIVFNTAYRGFTGELLKDYGGHSGTTIADNVGVRY
ncbi:MAG TPA: right-handed parallel beta-helix repeat-containing protein [Firmicutes bacterium]|nr:right-handed parallel beta-helix repeat-containing protein [Bacillota bacterium]